MKNRTAHRNELRGLLAEYGEVSGLGPMAFNAGMKAALARLAEHLPAMLIDTLREQWDELAKLDERIAWDRPRHSGSGREFAAWIGLVSAQTGTGGKVRLLGISKRGDTYLRTLLIHGARAVLTHVKATSQWLQDVGKRRPPNVVTVALALANKMARTI